MFQGYLTPERFRELRLAAGVSQAEAARHMGVTGGALCRYERRLGRPAIADWRLYRCADWLLERMQEAA